MSTTEKTELPDSVGVLIFPRLRIQNANAISSPMTHGFPSMTAFLGLMWALERKLAERFPLVFDSIGVICHRHEEQVSEGGYTKTFKLTRNPIDKDGSTAAIVEEGRIHLEVTLIIGVSETEIGSVAQASRELRAEWARAIADVLAGMRVAGGSVLPSSQSRWAQPALEVIPEDQVDAAKLFRRFRRQWLPGFALVCRDDLLARRHAALREQDASTSQLDAWLALSRFNWKPVRVASKDEAEAAEQIEWKHDRTEGWIVPIPIGYGALTDAYPPGTVANARDPSIPFRFVESLYSVGQWIGPHRLTDWRQLLWYAHSDAESGLYRACNDFAAAV